MCAEVSELARCQADKPLLGTAEPPEHTRRPLSSWNPPLLRHGASTPYQQRFTGQGTFPQQATAHQVLPRVGHACKLELVVFVDRQQLDGVDAELLKVRNALNEAQIRASACQCAIRSAEALVDAAGEKRRVGLCGDRGVVGQDCTPDLV